jgi:hypothetical protein
MIRRNHLVRLQALKPKIEEEIVPRIGPQLVWVQRLQADRNYWGFGDTIRGTISYIQACQKFGMELNITMNRHPISFFFTMKSPYINDCSSAIVTFAGDDGGLFKLESFKMNTVIYTNSFPDHPLTEYERQIMKSILQLKPEYSIKPPITPYTILHVRFDDKYLGAPLPESVKNNTMNLVKSYITESTILCTNISDFKDEVVKRTGFTQPQSTYASTHSGLSSSVDELKETIRDFQLLMHATTIYTYSEYGWVSGFVHWVSQIYKVPLINIKTAGKG